MSMPVQFAANLSLLYAELPFMQRFEAAAQDGFEAVEFLFAYSFDVHEIAAELKRCGLKQVLLNAPPGGVDAASIEAAWTGGMRGTAIFQEREAEFRAGFEIALHYARTLSCPRIHLMSGTVPEEMPREQALRELTPLLIERLRWAAAQAALHGIEILIEPLNPRDMPRYFLRTQAQAHELVQTVALPNVKVQFDFYHCQITEGDVATKIREYLPSGRVGHIQIAGVPERHEPNIGELNYAYLLPLLSELGYAGYVSAEYRPARGIATGATSAGLSWLKAFQA